MSGNYQPLYHFIRNHLLLEILDTNHLKGSYKQGDQYTGVSTTRNRDAKLLQTLTGDIRFVLDQNKLRRDGYKIKPFDYLSILDNSTTKYSIGKEYKYHKKFSPKRKFDNEAEEIIIGEITSLDKYLISIDFKDMYNHDSMRKNYDIIKAYKEKNPYIKIMSYVLGDIPIVWSLNKIELLINDEKKMRFKKYRKY